MDNKRLKMFIGITLIVLLVGFCGFYIYQKLGENKETFSEYTPEEEISDSQFRSTVVKLFFKETNSNNLRIEVRNVDAKELINNPYLTLVNLLLEGPSDELLENAIPNGTTVNSATLKGDTVLLDLSESFIANHPGGAETESATIYSIVNTLTELTEVNAVKFLIDGKDDCAFLDNAIKLDEPFVRR